MYCTDNDTPSFPDGKSPSPTIAAVVVDTLRSTMQLSVPLLKATDGQSQSSCSPDDNDLSFFKFTSVMIKMMNVYLGGCSRNGYQGGGFIIWTHVKKEREKRV